MPEMKRRVWLAQQQRAPRRAGGFRLSRLRIGVVVAGAILCVAGTSGAVIAARRWIVPALREVSRPAPKVASAAGAAQPRPRIEKTAPAPLAVAEDAPGPGSAVTAGAPGQLPAPVPVPKAAPKDASRAKPGVASRWSQGSHAARRGAAASSVMPRSAEPMAPVEAPQTPVPLAPTSPPVTAAAARERTQVLDAMIALRRDHDPVSAGAMLQQYLTSHPSGTLREEALVLAIEAAHARGDVALAKSLARAYQDAYPNGRFRRYAQEQAAPGRS